MNTSKIIHFAFLVIVTLLLGGIFAFSTEISDPLATALIWLVLAFASFATVYFPFTSRAFNFYELTLKQKILKYIKKTIILDVLIGVIGFVPILWCLFEANFGECYAGILSFLIWIVLGILFLLQITTGVIICLMHLIEKTHGILKYSLFLIIILALLFLIPLFNKLTQEFF